MVGQVLPAGLEACPEFRPPAGRCGHGMSVVGDEESPAVRPGTSAGEGRAEHGSSLVEPDPGHGYAEPPADMPRLLTVVRRNSPTACARR